MTRLAESQQQADAVTKVVKAIAHPLRLRIIALLCQSDQRVFIMAQRLGKSPAAISSSFASCA